MKKFFEEVCFELKKATWPSVQEIKDSALVILVSMFLLGCFIGVVDFIVTRVIAVLIN